MTSLFLELVSVPTEPCFSINIVDTPSLNCSFRAIASPITPPPITACVKSVSLLRLVENAREPIDLDEIEVARNANIVKQESVIEGYNDNREQQCNREKQLRQYASYTTPRKMFVLISVESIAFPMTLPNGGVALARTGDSSLDLLDHIGMISFLRSLNAPETGVQLKRSHRFKAQVVRTSRSHAHVQRDVIGTSSPDPHYQHRRSTIISP